MQHNSNFAAPCGLYCGVCAIHIAARDNNEKFKERLVDVYKGKIPEKGRLPGAEKLTTKDIQCNGCLSEEPFMHCRQCEIRICVKDRGYEGCHQCDEFPCDHIEQFPMSIGKKVILRAIPHWRAVGTQQWLERISHSEEDKALTFLKLAT